MGGSQSDESIEEDDSARQRGAHAGSFSWLPHHIGGPDTSLPIVVESFLAWNLYLPCLALWGYHYGRSIVLAPRWYSCLLYRRARALVRGILGGWIYRLVRPRNANTHPEDGDDSTWLPLTTHSHAELNSSPWDRYISLVRYLEKEHPEALTPLMVMEKGEDKRCRTGSISERSLPSMNDLMATKCQADAALVRVLRRDEICRRLASLAMRQYDAAKFATVAAVPKSTYSHPTTLLTQFPHNRLLQRMSKLWKDVLVLPSLEECINYYRLPDSGAAPVASARCKLHANDANYPYRISLVLPAYHEKGSHLMSNLKGALETAANPNEVEVVVADAGGCSDLDMLLTLAEDTDGDQGSCFGRVAIYSFVSGGGRGPCLNFGASVATGRILTFCHSDTTMPCDWDDKIVSTLENDGSHSIRANSCAFGFGIDTSREGLSMQFESSNSVYCPPGITAVETATNLRCRLFSLPYGDQVLSLHARVFEFLGGYPDQCLMEDYDLVNLLRKRAALFVSPSDLSGRRSKEILAIIPGPPARCSPRRWQKFGVLYVTYMNTKFVTLYTGSTEMDPNELFRLYYGRAPPKRAADDSPWQLKLAKILGS